MMRARPLTTRSCRLAWPAISHACDAMQSEHLGNRRSSLAGEGMTERVLLLGRRRLAESLLSPLETRGLTEWLTGVHVESFVRDYFGKQCAYVPDTSGERARVFGQLMSEDEAWSLSAVIVEQSESDWPASASGMGAALYDEDGSYSDIALADMEQVERAYRGGATVFGFDLHRHDPVTARMLRQLRREWSMIGAVGSHIQLDRPGSGFRTHIDNRVHISLQVKGSKRWTVWHDQALRGPENTSDASIRGSTSRHRES